MSISQINRVRAALGISNHPKTEHRKKNRQKRKPLQSQPEWQEGAGSLLLLAAAQQTELLPRSRNQPSRPTFSPLIHHCVSARSLPWTLRCQLLTLLFLEAVGLRRTWDLRGYTGQALALLTGRRRAYGYRHTERFLAELASLEQMRPSQKLWHAGPLLCGSHNHT